VDFSFTDEQSALRELARKILEAEATPDRLREVERGEERIDRALWATLAEANLLGAALPEARIREEAPEGLLAAQQAAAAGFAATPVAAGAALEFAAIFAPAPGEARGFALAPGRTR